MENEAGREFSVLIVPDCEWIPEELEQWIVYAVRNGLPVPFAGRSGVMKSGGASKASAAGKRCTKMCRGWILLNSRKKRMGTSIMDTGILKSDMY